MNVTNGLIPSFVEYGVNPEISSIFRRVPSPVHEAVYNDDPGALVSLLRAGYSADVLDEERRTPLMRCFEVGGASSFRCVEAVLSSGASPSQRDPHGFSPIMIADSLRLSA